MTHPNSPEAMEAEKKGQGVSLPPDSNGKGRQAVTMTSEMMVAQNAASETTKIEAVRAQAEVVAAVMAARQMPRNEARCRQHIMEMCQERAWAVETSGEGSTRAFYKFRRGKDIVSDITVHVATEMLRIWGNAEAGIKELARADHQSEMAAYAVDWQNNTRFVSHFIVPHTRDVKRGGERVKDSLHDDRDVYENNASQAARRMREMIKRVIPRYIIDEAKDTLLTTMARGEGTPLPERRRKLADAFYALGVTEAMLQEAAGAPVADLTERQVADLRITFQSIKSGEITIREAFGAPAQPTGPLAAAVKEKEAAKAGGTGGTPETGGKPDGETSGGNVGTPQKDATPVEWSIAANERVIDGLTRVLALAESAGMVAAIMGANEARIARESKSNQAVAASMAKKRAEELSQ